jgi:hypothetical protein
MLYVDGNVSGGNQPLRANYRNFNRSHTMLIQRRAHRRWEGWFAKVPLQIIPPTSHEFCTSPLLPFMNLSLDQHHVVPIEISIVCTEGLVSTWYVPLFDSGRDYITKAAHIQERYLCIPMFTKTRAQKGSGWSPNLMAADNIHFPNFTRTYIVAPPVCKKNRERESTKQVN